jgi:hypothetical protein
MASGSEIPQDLRQMLAAVCAQHNVRIDSDDPAVAIVTLNRLVFEEAQTRAVEQIRTATAELETQLRSVQLRAGALLAQEFRTVIQNVAIDANNNVSSAAPRNRLHRALNWLFLGALTFAVVFGSGVWVGTLIR